MNIETSVSKDKEEQIVTLRIRKNIVELVDKERSI